VHQLPPQIPGVNQTHRDGLVNAHQNNQARAEQHQVLQVVHLRFAFQVTPVLGVELFLERQRGAVANGAASGEQITAAGYGKEKGQSRVLSIGVLYWEVYGQTVTSFGKTVYW
jgi:hypothetical protein